MAQLSLSVHNSNKLSLRRPNGTEGASDLVQDLNFQSAPPKKLGLERASAAVVVLAVIVVDAGMLGLRVRPSVEGSLLGYE